MKYIKTTIAVSENYEDGKFSKNCCIWFSYMMENDGQWDRKREREQIKAVYVEKFEWNAIHLSYALKDEQSTNYKHILLQGINHGSGEGIIIFNDNE